MYFLRQKRLYIRKNSTIDLVECVFLSMCYILRNRGVKNGKIFIQVNSIENDLYIVFFVCNDDLDKVMCYIIGLVRYGVVLYGVAWYCVAWYGMVWYAMVWYVLTFKKIEVHCRALK